MNSDNEESLGTFLEKNGYRLPAPLVPAPVGKLRWKPSPLGGSWLCVHAQAAGPAHLDSCGCGHSLCHPLLHIQVNSPVSKAAVVCERRLCHGVHGPVAGAVDHRAEDEC